MRVLKHVAHRDDLAVISGRRVLATMTTTATAVGNDKAARDAVKALIDGEFITTDRPRFKGEVVRLRITTKGARIAKGYAPL